MSDRIVLVVLLVFICIFFCFDRRETTVPPYALRHTCKGLVNAEPSDSLCEARREISRLRKSYTTARVLIDIMTMDMRSVYDVNDEDLVDQADAHAHYDPTTGEFAPLRDCGCDETDKYAFGVMHEDYGEDWVDRSVRKKDADADKGRDVLIYDFPMNTELHIEPDDYDATEYNYDSAPESTAPIVSS